jgi:probable phosphoglycerate mutase
MAILLIRHGETAGNRDRIVQRPETPLSERGLEQAGRLGHRLAASGIDEIWSSDLPRARMTAEAIVRTTGAPLREASDLQERNFGDLRGTPYSQLDFDPFAPEYIPPRGESQSGFDQRVDRAWRAIERHFHESFAGRDVGHLAVVTHGLFCRSLLTRQLLTPAQLEGHLDDRGQLSMGNTALTVIEADAPGSERSFRVELLACTAHLAAELSAAARRHEGTV